MPPGSEGRLRQRPIYIVSDGTGGTAEKVVRVGAKQNFGGGDFSNADIFRLSLVRDYDPTLAGEETAEGEAEVAQAAALCHRTVW